MNKAGFAHSFELTTIKCEAHFAAPASITKQHLPLLAVRINIHFSKNTSWILRDTLIIDKRTKNAFYIKFLMFSARSAIVAHTMLF